MSTNPLSLSFMDKETRQKLILEWVRNGISIREIAHANNLTIQRIRHFYNAAIYRERHPK